MKHRNSSMMILTLAFLCIIAFGNFVSGQKVTTKEAHQKSKTTDHVYWLITANVKDRELKNLKQINAEMVKNTEENEPDTLTYDWSISDDGKKCYFFEHYANSKAVMVHTKTFGEKFANRLLGMIEIESFQVFGNPDEEVRNSLSPLGAKFHSSIGGFSR